MSEMNGWGRVKPVILFFPEGTCTTQNSQLPLSFNVPIILASELDTVWP